MISSGLTDITLTWQFVDKYTHTEIWAHTQDNQADALMVGKVFGSTFTHNIGAEQVRYYWVRHTRGQNVGYFHQERGLRGETAVDIDKELNVLNKKLSKNIVNQVIDTALPARGLEPVKTVSGLDVNQFLGNKLVYNQLDGRLYTWNGTKYEYKTPASNIDGSILPAQLAPIPTTKLSGQLTDAQISNVSANKIAGIISVAQLAPIPTTKLSGTISAHQISTNSIGANAIQAGAIGTEKLAAGSVSAAKLQANSVGANHLQANSVTAGAIAANAVTAGAINTGAVNAQHIAAGQVTADKLAIGLGGNLLYNPIFSNLDSGGVPYGWTRWLAGGASLINNAGNINDTWSPKIYANEENFIRYRINTSITSGIIVDLWQEVGCSGGNSYMLSCYVGAHRCAALLQVRVVDINNNITATYSSRLDKSGFTGGYQGAGRLFVKVTTKRNDVKLQCILFGVADSNEPDKVIMFARPMLEECTQYTTEPSVWQNAGVTAIHGGSIVTETVTAQKLASDSVTANKIAAGAVAARHIATNTINANHIQTKALNADKLNIQKLSAISADFGDMRAGSININNRFVVGSDGRVEIRNQTANVGMVINNDNICVYDASGRLRVKLGRLS